MSSKITIIGAGSVGATIAYKLSYEDFASEIVMIDINKDKVEGEVMDIEQGTCFRSPISIVAGDYEDAKGSDIVIITSNVNIIKSITPEIVKAAPDAKYIIVSNPVDVLTYVFTKISGLPENQIIGSGTLLDTARLRYGLSRHFKVAQKNIHAYVYGEHGDSSFVPWSGANIASMPIDDYYKEMKALGADLEELDKPGMEEYVHKSGGQVIAKKGATFYAVAVSVVELCNLVLAASDSVATVSSMMHGEYGVDDVCLSVLSLVGPNGVQGKVPMHLTDEEIEKLQASANKLKEVIAQLDI